MWRAINVADLLFEEAQHVHPSLRCCHCQYVAVYLFHFSLYAFQQPAAEELLAAKIKSNYSLSKFIELMGIEVFASHLMDY